jgi:peptidyl-prolyl cis-trans isomerase SurA
MKMFPAQASDETIANLKLSADSIWTKATSGEDFAELAKKYSDDKQSGAAGGVMNWFTKTNMVPEFAEASFKLQNDNDISPVIRTPYGWHIIKRLEHRPIEAYEEMKPKLETKIKQNPNINSYSDEAFVRELRSGYQLKTNDGNFQKLIVLLSDTTGDKNLSEKTTNLGNSELFSFANKKFTVSDFTTSLMTQNYNPKTANPEKSLKTELEKFEGEKLLEYEDSQLEEKHPDFANVYREYHDGILLFNISKDKIWDVASTDTVRLKNYFDTTTKKYYWTDCFRGWKIEAKDAGTKTRLETMLESKELTKQEITDIFNTKTENNVQITDVAVEKGEDPIVDYYIWSGPKPANFDQTTTFVHGKQEQNVLKELKDAMGLYSSDFQEQIEKEWIDSLRQKYPVKINKKVLKKIQAVG